MLDELLRLYMPHGHCYLWSPGLLSLHVVSDAAIALAYFAIPICLLLYYKNKNNQQIGSTTILFSVFILSCGITHVLEIVAVWFGLYWITGLAKGLTAVVSVATAIQTVRILPTLLEMPTVMDLEREIEKRKVLEKELEKKSKEAFNLADKTSRKLENEQVLNNMILAVSDEAFAIVDKVNEKVMLSDNLRTLLALKNVDNELRLNSFLNLFGTETRSSLSEAISVHKKTSKDAIRVRILNKEHEEKWYAAKVTHSDIGEGKNQVGIMLRDITEFKNKESILLKKAELAAFKSKQSNLFLANMSHEIRTPMTGIVGVLEILQDRQLDSESKKYLDIATNAGHSLLHVINDILDYSSILNKGVELKVEATNLNRLIR